MAEEHGVLRRIVWRDVFPGIMLFRCFRLSVTLPILFLATVGTLLMPVGPWLTGVNPQDHPVIIGAPTLSTDVQVARPRNPAWITFADSVSMWGLPKPRTSVQDKFLTLIRPFVNLFDRQATTSQLFKNLGVGLWYLLVWSLIGGAITRIAVVRLGCGEPVTTRQAVRHAVINYGWYVGSPMFPLLGVALTAVPLIFLGLLMRAGVGILVAGVLWPLALVGGLIMAVLLTHLLFGWLLMWPTISAEEAGDSFQAFSNSFSFTFQRPLQYLAYAVIAILVGAIGGLFVEGFAAAVVSLTHWGVSIGLGTDRLNQLLEGQLDHTTLGWLGSGLIETGNRVVLRVADAYYFSFLFCTASAIYLLLRREVDQTDFDEVYLPETAEPFSLPPLKSGPHGVPEVDEPPPRAADRPSE